MSLARKMAGVGLTQIVELALQLLTPVVLVRVLDIDAFAAYRWVWLLAGTVAAIAPLGMIISLFYFLPRSEPQAKLQFILQAAFHLLLAASMMVVGAWLLHAYLPGDSGLFLEHGPVLSLFVVVWCVGLLLDQLPTADERVRWQMFLSIGLAIVRSVALLLAAWFGQSVEAILSVLCAFVLLKFGLLIWYVQRHHGKHDWKMIRVKEHVSHAWPLGAASVLFGLRRQIEQWLVAALFSPLQFAAFSIAATLAPIMVMARKSVGAVLMPGMSRAQDKGDLPSMLKVNQAGNLVVTSFMSPLLAVVTVYADVLVSWVYTSQYSEAANVLRVFVALWYLQMIDFNSLVVMLKEGPFVARINAPLLAVAVIISYTGGQIWGLPGAALGGVVATYLERILLARRLAKRLNVSFYTVQPWVFSAGLSIFFLFACLGYRWLSIELQFQEVTAMLLAGLIFGVSGLLLSRQLIRSKLRIEK